MALADDAALVALEHQVLHPDVVRLAGSKALAALRPSADYADATRRELRAEIEKIGSELGRLTEALVAGWQLQAILAAIKDREGRRQRLTEELAIVEGTGRLGDLDVERLRRTLGERLDDLLHGQPVQARQILRKLVAGRLIFTPKIDEQGRYYEFAGHGTLGQVLAGAFHARANGDPGGLRQYH